MDKIKSFLTGHRHGFVLLYFVVIYLPWFHYLEDNVHIQYIMGSWADSLIPFQEIFVIPYLFWFAFVAAAFYYFGTRSKEDFFRLCIFLFTGMTICLTIYTLFPNGQTLRPTTFARDNFLVDIVKFIYSMDSPTNVSPSIHVLNSIGVCTAVFHSKLFRNKKRFKAVILAITVLICISTMFIKQHSINDVLAACVLSIPMYFIAYRANWKVFSSQAEKEDVQLGFSDVE